MIDVNDGNTANIFHVLGTRPYT